MDFGLTQEPQILQDTARNFSESEIAPYVDEDEENHCVRREIYAKDRVQFGKPIGMYQLIQQQISEMKMEHEALAALVHKAAWLKDHDLPNVMETSMAKLFAAKAVVHAANECMKLHGSYGYTTEYPCGRFLRDSKQFETLEGTSNMHAMIVANAALGYFQNRV
jgi:glutaryl-CoA dehydrogenase (non-decarboxylating)